jgi:hypothetical protein
VQASRPVADAHILPFSLCAGSRQWPGEAPGCHPDIHQMRRIGYISIIALNQHAGTIIHGYPHRKQLACRTMAFVQSFSKSSQHGGATFESR